MKSTVVALVLLFALGARADTVAFDMSGTSPAGASATVIDSTPASQIGMYATCSFIATVQGGAGGTLDIFVQTFIKSKAGGFWVDAAHLPSLAAAASAATFAFTLTRFSPTNAAITAGLNTASGTPALTANTVVPGLLGYQLRIVYKTGAGNTAGAAQTILATCSDT